MNAIQLHDKEEEIIGTVLLKDGVDFNQITDLWDKYLAEVEENNEFPEISEFVEKNSDICELLYLEFYQPY